MSDMLDILAETLGLDTPGLAGRHRIAKVWESDVSGVYLVGLQNGDLKWVDKETILKVMNSEE